MKICVYAIAKNEEKFVDAWFASMSEADGIYVLDTGSTDGTVEKLKAHGVHVESYPYAEGEFRFDDARNRSLALVPDDCDLCVCTDLDETLTEGWRAETERQFAEALERNPNTNCAEYDYYYAMDEHGNPTSRFNQFKMHLRHHAKWIYYCHEVLDYDVPRVCTFIKKIRLLHHQDVGKERAKMYLTLLERQAKDTPEDCRASHYLGREYMYNGMYDKAIAEFMRHLSLKNGWTAERAQSMRFMARCYRNLENAKDAEYWYAKAVAEEPTQREAAVELSEYAAENGEFEICAFAAKSALLCTEKTPIYLTEERCWGALPYHLLSVGMSNKVNREWKPASIAASIALRLEPNNENYWRNMIGLNGQSPIYPQNPSAHAIHGEWDKGLHRETLPVWENLFDKVYCIHYLGNKEREAHMRSEFGRVGLWDNRIFKVWETVRTLWEAKLGQNQCAGIVNLALQTMRILLTAKAKGYERILIWEDDVCMLRDLSLFTDIFNDTPKDADITVYDKMVFIHANKFSTQCEQRRISKHFAMWDDGVYSGSCYAVGKNAYDPLIAYFERELNAPDDATQIGGVKKAFSIVNTSVQCLYSDSMFPERFGGYNTKNGYAFQGIDYSRYNVPDGYGYDAPLDPNELLK